MTAYPKTPRIPSLKLLSWRYEAGMWISRQFMTISQWQASRPLRNIISTSQETKVLVVNLRLQLTQLGVLVDFDTLLDEFRWPLHLLHFVRKSHRLKIAKSDMTFGLSSKVRPYLDSIIYDTECNCPEPHPVRESAYRLDPLWCWSECLNGIGLKTSREKIFIYASYL